MATFADVLRQLTPEAKDLLVRMVDAHLASDPGDREFFTVRTGAGTGMIFTGNAPFNGEQIDRTALNDLSQTQAIRLLRHDRHRNPVFDIGPNARRLYALLMAERGHAASSVEEPVRRMMESRAMVEAHPGVAHHLSEAFALLWSDSTSDQTVSELGAHLRSALADLVGDLTARQSNPEQIAKSLETWVAGRAEVRSGNALVSMAKTVLALTQRLTHIREEANEGRPIEGWHELRRAAFLTSLLCYELAEVASGR